jgi:MFS family permease
MGFLGILEDHKLPHVPATVRLEEISNQPVSDTRNLKHATGKKGASIVLVPQPSEDPNDPLNWSQTKKLTVTIILCFGGVMFASVISGLLNPAVVVIATDYGRPIGDIVLLSGYQLLVAASTGAFVNAFSRKYGKRPVFLVSSLLGFIGSIVGSVTKNYSGLLAARIIQGGSTAAYESLLVSGIGDLYFVHERGLYMAAVQFVLGCVSNFVGIVAGPITTNLGWRYLFHLCVLFTGLQAILLFLFCPETQYNRALLYNTDETVEENLEAVAALEKKKGSARHYEEHESGTIGEPVTNITTTSTRESRIPPKKSFLQELAVTNGTFTDENLFQLVIAPFAACSNVVVLWITIITGTMTATYVAQAIVLAQIFTPPPYQLTPTGVGNLFLGPFAGGVIATVIIALIYDPLIKACACKNNGIYEPEFRLVIIPAGFLAGAAMMGWGIACEQHVSVYATSALHGVILFGILVVAISASSYGLDAFRDLSGEMFVAGIIYKNFLFYGFSNFVNNWVTTAGPAKVFYALGGLNIGFVALAPIFYVFGKRYRSIWARYNILEHLKIRSHPEI